jgi:FkbM family methyltransferase
MSTLREKLSLIPGVRPVALRMLRALGSRDVNLRHPVTHDRLSLNLFLHRGYWFHRSRREESETAEVSDVLRGAKGTIVDVGANIGFLSLIYRAIAPHAEVVAVEPSRKNLRRLRPNIDGLVILVAPVAVGSGRSAAHLVRGFLDRADSSLVEIFKSLAASARRAWLDAQTAEVRVDVATLYELPENARRPVPFMNTDVESFEAHAPRKQ